MGLQVINLSPLGSLCASAPSCKVLFPGETPLHTAAVQDCKHAPIATLLLAGGADVHAEDRMQVGSHSNIVLLCSIVYAASAMIDDGRCARPYV